MNKYFLIIMSLMLLPEMGWTRPLGQGSIGCGNPRDAYSCMVCNCYNEAGNQSYAGQVAVGKVVKSRMYVNMQDRRAGRKARYESTECGVIKEHKQFSWWDAPGAMSRRSVPGGHSCFKAAREAMAFNGYYADHYHAYYVSPKWRRNMRVTNRIGAHTFYAAAGFRQTPGNNYRRYEQDDNRRRFFPFGNVFAFVGYDKDGVFHL